ncbi:MAG: sodium/solute symporter [Planctomycetia bacterium]|nr:sodium/solute symporter [Planctomycetia bacterium]
MDYVAFGSYFVILCAIGLWTGRKEKTHADDYFLAGRTLPWYVVGSSFIASNICTEHFIGMIGAAFVYGICVAMSEWGNVLSFSVLIWLFIPFLLASRVFTTPEFIVMLVGGLMVTILGLLMLSGEQHSLVEGWNVMIERNQAQAGIWREVVEQNAQNCARVDHYNRLSVIQPITHETNPWPALLLGLFSVSIWYNVINQFMIQRVLGAKNMYHARMGIVLAGYMKVLMPVIVVVPGLIMFAQFPEVMQRPWPEIRAEADKGYIHMLQTLIPVGLRGLFLAALFGAIQSTVNSVLNSTATVFTLDVYQRLWNRQASETHLVRMGMGSSVVILIISIVIAGFINRLGGSLFVYIQSLYAFFAPPFGAVFVLGVLWRRINGPGAVVAVILGFLLGIGMKLYVQFVPDHVAWLEPYSMQGIVNWAFCVVVCITVSLLTAPPRPEQVTDQLTFNWQRLNIFSDLGERWYTNVVTWWGLFVVLILALFILFSGLFL